MSDRGEMMPADSQHVRPSAWTTKPPNRPCWCWWRDGPMSSAYMAKIVATPSGCLVVSVSTEFGDAVDVLDKPNSIGGYWSGPILPPE